jgi:hypothetical protein
MVEKTIEIKVNSKNAQQSINDTTNSINKTGDAVGGLTSALDKMTGGAISAFNGIKSGVKSGIAAMKSLKVAIAATGIGLLVVAVGALTAAFRNSEEGQNRLAKVMGVLGSVTGNLMDIFASLGNVIIDVFTKPQDVIQDMGDRIQSFFIDKITKITEGLGFLGSAITKAFSGDFKGALADAGKGVIELNRGLNPAVILTESLVKSTAKLTEELIREGKIAADIADMRAKADKKDRQLIVERAEADRDRAELLEKAVNKEIYSTQERIAFLEEAGRLEQEITNKEIEAARLRYEAKVEENALAGSTKEDLDEEAELKAQLIQLETARLTKQKEVTGQIISLKNEEAAAEKAIQDKKDADAAEAEAKRLEAEQAEREARQRILEETLADQDLEIMKAQQKYDALIEEARKYGLDESELIEAKNKAINDINAKYDKEDSDRKKKKADDDLAVQYATIGAIAGTLGSLSELAGKDAKTGKALSAAQAIINTYTGATKALAQGGIAGPIAAAGVIASGIASVRSIYATDVPDTTPPSVNLGGRSFGGGGASGGGTAAIPAIPRPQLNASIGFDTSGANLGNQIAESLSGTAMRAYVVNQDIQSAGKLDRKIEETATFG